MKKSNFGILVALLIGGFSISGCGGSVITLKRSWAISEQARTYSYYDLRANGLAFSSKFYNDCDSVGHTLTGENLKLITAYQTIQIARESDSLNTNPPSFYTHTRDIVNSEFEIAKGVITK